jgi:hypothetical protein
LETYKADKQPTTPSRPRKQIADHACSLARRPEKLET